MIADWLMEAISNIILSHVLSLLVLLGLNFHILLRGQTTPLSKSYMILSLSPLLWISGKIIKTVAPTLGLRWAGILIQYAGMSSLGPSYLLFCLCFFRHTGIARRIITLLYVPSVVSFTLIATNPLHHQFYPIFTFYRDSFGPVFHGNSWLIYTCLGVGTVLLIIELVRRDRKYRNQILLFIVAALIPLLASLYYPRLGNIYSGLRFDITPVAFSLSFLCFGIAVFRYNFLNIPRIAYEQIIETLPEGIIAYENGDNLIYANAEGRKSKFKLEENMATGVWANEDRIYSFQKKRIAKTGQNGISLFTLHDQSERIRRKQDTERRVEQLKTLTIDIQHRIDEERELLQMNERIRAAQELHDILGHSLTLLISQLEALKLVDRQDERRKRLKRIEGIIESGREELHRVLGKTEQEEKQKEICISGQLKNLATQCTDSGHRVELVLQGTEPMLESETARNIYSICRECVTNSIRHGGAQTILIRLDFTGGFSMLIMDNGIGCDSIQEGTGLAGIRRRAASLKAELRLASTANEGFTTRLSIPKI